MYISIHALLAESDPLAKVRHCEGYIFLSTLSLRRATMFPCFIIIYIKISIHALLAESDLRCPAIHRCQPVHFYPRSPCGERLNDGARRLKIDVISIHALLAESDPNVG